MSRLQRLLLRLSGSSPEREDEKIEEQRERIARRRAGEAREYEGAERSLLKSIGALESPGGTGGREGREDQAGR